MPKSTPAKDFRSLGYVLRRTNYGEADRILNIITPSGKISAIAKSARKEKSKLAGGIEMFSLVDLNFHTGKSDFAIVTSARMLKYHSNIIKNLPSLELASNFLKSINKISENSDSPEYFTILDQSLTALDANINHQIIIAWFNFNLKQASGEEINLYRDVSGNKLNPALKYFWDFHEKSLIENADGDISSDEIKIMRLMLTTKLGTVAKIKNIDEKISPIFKIAKGL